jgi:hypothetical protein
MECEFNAWPIVPSSPAVRPAPNSMKTAIPFAVEERTMEPRIERAITITTPPASSSPGATFDAGVQCPVTSMIVSAIPYTAST